MTLRAYERKRDFTRTGEPAPRSAATEGKRRFVIQKHDASRLHYDFRLEMKGVLKSWAVPKGLPWQKGERHLAIQVEDHPVEYFEFEGVIPKGQYGGGTVMVWDSGEYESIGAEPSAALRDGKLHLLLHGSKAKGEWTLVRKGRDADDETWFLIKTGLGAAGVSKSKEEHSALSGRTMPQIAAEKSAVWESDRKGASLPGTGAAGRKGKTSVTRAGKSSTGLGPEWVVPMKAKLVQTPPAGADWMYELKWDGYRAIAIKDGSTVELFSRNHNSMTKEFPEVCAAIREVPIERFVVDGEICALDSDGRPRFQLLQHRDMGSVRPTVYFYVFDLLHLEGRDLKQTALEDRKKALQRVLAGAPEKLRFSGALESDPQAILGEVRARGMEGVIGKRRDSRYEPGLRSGVWIKVKVTMEQEFVIGGFTPPKGARERFGALLTGYYEGSRLRFAGKVGAGFDRAALDEIYEILSKIVNKDCPFADLPRKGGGRWGQAMTPSIMRTCTWVRPKAVCEVRFSEWTSDGSLRHPVFVGMRKDKEAAEVVREIAAES